MPNTCHVMNDAIEFVGIEQKTGFELVYLVSRLKYSHMVMP